MKEEIKLLEQKIENTLLKLSLNSELSNTLKVLEKYYLSMKKDISSMSNDFKLREYYALLLSFDETYISYATDLVANKKGDKSIYDSSDNKIDENISIKEKELETLVTYLKKEFSMVGNILEKRLINLKEEYSSSLNSGLSKSKNDSDLYLGVTNKTELSFGTIDMIKKLYLNNLEIFDELFLEKLKNMISKNLQISKQYELLIGKLNEYKEDSNFISLISKLDLLLKEYRNKCEYVLSNVSFNDINNKISSIQNDYINRLNQLETSINNLIKGKEKIKYYQDLMNYLENINLNDINYDKLLEIESFLISNNLQMEEFYNKLYIIIEYELIDSNKSKTYDIISLASKGEIEKLFIDKIKETMPQGIERDNYLARYIKEGFNIEMLLDLIENVDELKLENKKIITKEIEYKNARNFSEGLSAVHNNEGLWGYIDKTGKEIIKCQYKDFRDFSEGLSAVRNKEDLWGYIDKTGKEIIKCQYKNAGDFSEGLSAVQNNEGLWGYIDKTGKEIIKCQYKDFRDFSEGLVCVQNKENLWGYIDKTGKEVIKCQYKDFRDFSEGLVAVHNNEGLWGYIDKTGKEVIKCKYKNTVNFSEGLAAVQNKDYLWGYIDKTGKEVIKCKYEDFRNFHGGLVAVRNKEDLWGYIDKTGKEIIKCQYKNVGDFSEGLAIVTSIIGTNYILSTPKANNLGLDEFSQQIQYKKGKSYK